MADYVEIFNCPGCHNSATIVWENSPTTGRGLYRKIAWHQATIIVRKFNEQQPTIVLTEKQHLVTCPFSELRIEEAT